MFKVCIVPKNRATVLIDERKTTILTKTPNIKKCEIETVSQIFLRKSFIIYLCDHRLKLSTWVKYDNTHTNVT